MDLSYIIDKIQASDWSEIPFRHIEINDLFEKEDFEKIVHSPEISTKSAHSDKILFDNLFDSNYRIIGFPGCTKDYKEYIKWHKDKKKSYKTNTACEGYGVVVRLQSPKSPAIEALNDFIESREFIECIATKFNIHADECVYDAGIQKYLDGYEISPHPDVRRKALTYMVNINPSPTSSEDDHHTSYLQFKPEWSYIKEFWQGNETLDRCWVPWNWCDVKKQQRRNNSIVIFSPSNNTIHGVKANYDHLTFQRTQLYGNLWLRDVITEGMPTWEDFVIETNNNRSKIKTVQAPRVKYLSGKILQTVKSLSGSKRKHGSNESTHAKRKISNIRTLD